MSTVPVESIAGLLARHARETPEALALRHLVDGESEVEEWSYAKLDRTAREIAGALRTQGAEGKRALLLYPPGPQYVAAFFGCLYAGVVPVPAYPPDPVRLTRTLPRLRAIIDDCRASVALTVDSIRDMAETMLADVVTDRKEPLTWLATDALPAGEAARTVPEQALPGDIAFLQYTSGSTTTPRGVMVTHGNLLHNLADIQRRSGPVESYSGVMWLPPYHDMGLIGGILTPIYMGVFVTLLSPLDFLQRPVRWLNAMTRYKGTVTAAPNFAYDLCVRKSTPSQRMGLDLSSWCVSYNGAEPINPETMDRFVQTFGPCGFRRTAFLSCYGLAEGTLMSTGAEAETPPIVRRFKASALARGRIELATGDHDEKLLVGAGQPITGQRVEIVDPATRLRCAPGQVGEIWLQGPSVAAGYWNRPEETAATFQARIADDGSGPYLRTGDLGVLHDGELIVTGRIKDLIIVSGENHYPQDIERTIEASHSMVRPGASAAFAVDIEGHERIVIVAETDAPESKEQADSIRTAIRRAVTDEHQLPPHAVVLLKRGGIPRTSSGKIQRHACRDGFLAGTLDMHDL